MAHYFLSSWISRAGLIAIIGCGNRETAIHRYMTIGYLPDAAKSHLGNPLKLFAFVSKRLEFQCENVHEFYMSKLLDYRTEISITSHCNIK